jgi:hypothetical protein
MVCFQTKNLDLGKFWRAFEWKKAWYIIWSFGKYYGHLVYFTAIWYISRPFSNFVAIRYIFPRFGILCQEKSGNPGGDLNARKAPAVKIF